MGLFDHPDFDGHETVAFFSDRQTGCRGIVAIHRTSPLGVSGGGCRIWPYHDEAEALRDVLRLSQAMTYKLAFTGMPAGGGKAVVIGDPRRDKSEALLRAIGRAVDRLGGRFIVSEDVGTTPEDMAIVARETPWVNRDGGGFPETAPATALSVLFGIRAAARRRLGRADLEGLRVAVQGVGQVGGALCRHLASSGARLVVADVDPEALAAVVQETGARPTSPEAIFAEDVDVLAPCALADAISDHTLGRLRCEIVAGGANNQLADPRLADALAARGILYAPDFVINAGGTIGAACGSHALPGVVEQRIEALGEILEQVFSRAERERISTHAAAVRIGKERLVELGIQP